MKGGVSQQVLWVMILLLCRACPLYAQDSSVQEPFLFPQGYRPEFRRELNREQIAAEQRAICRADGRADSLFAPTGEAGLNQAISYSLLHEVNRIRFQIETDATLDHRLKVNYLYGLQSLLAYFREQLSQPLGQRVNPAYLPLIIAKYEDCFKTDLRGESIAPIIVALPYEAGNNILAARIFESNLGYGASKENLLLKYCTLFPDKTFITLQQYPTVSFADSILKVVARSYPRQFYDYAAASDRLGQRIRSIKDDPFVQLVAQMAGSRSGQQYFPFVDNILKGRVSVEQIDQVKEDTLAYYRLLVSTQMDYVDRALQGDTALEYRALSRRLEDKARANFVSVINGLHSEKDLAVRFRIIQPLTAAELYYLAVSSDGSIYTSSFVRGVYPLMMSKIAGRGDSLLMQVRFDKYRKFIKMAAAFNTLDQFLASFVKAAPGKEDPANILMKAFVKNLERTEGLEDGADVADSYASIAETLQPVARRMLQNIEQNYQEAVARQNTKGIIIYRILQHLFWSADTARKVDLTKELGIPPVYQVPFRDLGNDSGRVVVQLFIYGDKDGIGVFPGLVNMFSGQNWKIDQSSKYWVAVHSARGKKVSLYMNRPLPEETNEDAKAQEELNLFLTQQGLIPRVTINRGHSYNAPYTIAQMSTASKIVFMGSCGGYNMIHDILEKAPDAHIIGTKQIADAPVNNPFLRLLMEKLRNGADIEWIGFWKELDSMVTDKIFEDYVPPHKNLGALFIKAYTKATGTGSN